MCVCVCVCVFISVLLQKKYIKGLWNAGMQKIQEASTPLLQHMTGGGGGETGLNGGKWQKNQIPSTWRHRDIFLLHFECDKRTGCTSWALEFLKLDSS